MAVNNPIVRFLTGHKSALEDSTKAPAIEPGQVLFTIQQNELSRYKGYIYYDTVDDDGKPIRLMMSGEGGSSFSDITIIDKDDNYGATVVVGDSDELELPLPDYINTNYFYASEIIPLNHTLLKGADSEKDTGKGKTYFHGSGMLMVSPYYTHQEGLVRIIGESSSKPDITVEIATRDLYTDDNINAQIVARQYDKNNNILREAKLLTRTGDSEFPGDILLTKDNGNIWWTTGEMQQRIRTVDDKKSDNEVFVFEQSADTGKTWDTLMTIRDNGKVLATADLVSLNGIVRAIEGAYGAILYNDGINSGIYLTDSGSQMGAADVENPPFSVYNATGNVAIGAEPDAHNTYKLTVYGSQEIYDIAPVLNIHAKTTNPAVLSFENNDYKRNVITANHINNEGFNLVIDAGGNMYLGSGASATQLYELQKTSTSEKLYLTSDEEVFIEANANDLIGNRIGVAVDKEGNFYPVAAENNNTNRQTLGKGGDSASRWKAVYIGSADKYGDPTQPIYWDNGVPKATDYFLKASVSQGSDSNRLAYYLTDTEIAQTAHFANETQIGVNYTGAFTQALYVKGETYFNGNVTHQGHILPGADNSYDIGATGTQAWRNAFFKGIVRASQIGTGYPTKTAAADGKAGAWLDAAGDVHLTSSTGGNTINFYWNGGTTLVAKITMPETGTLEVTDRLTVGYDKSKMFYEGKDQTTAETFAVNGTGFFLDTLRSKGSIVTNDGTIEVRSDNSATPYVKLSSMNGTTTTVGRGIIEIGNNTASGKADNANGQLIMYGTSANKKLEITTDAIPTLTIWTQDGNNYYTNGAGATANDFWQIYTNGQDLRFLTHNGGSTSAASDSRYITFFEKGGIAINSTAISNAIASRTDDANLYVNGGTVLNGILTSSSWIMTNRTDATGYFYGRIDNIDYTKLGPEIKGTSSVVGIGLLELGNNKATGTANNARGKIRIYSTTDKYTEILAQSNGNYTVFLPYYADNMYLTHVADNDAVGGVYKGTYVAENGRITPMTYELKASIDESLAANRMAYYSGTNTISPTGHYTSVDKVAINSATAPTQNFYVNGASYFNGRVTSSNTFESTFDGPAFLANLASGSWGYLRLKSGATFWDVAVRDTDNAGALQFRMQGNSSPRTMIKTDGRVEIWAEQGQNNTLRLFSDAEESSICYSANTTDPYTIWTVGRGTGAIGSTFGWWNGSRNVMMLGNDGALTLRPGVNSDMIIGGRWLPGDPVVGNMDGNDRPGIRIYGDYPQLVLMSGRVNNAQHGATISLGGYDSGTALTGAHKHFTFGTPGYNVTWMDLTYSTALNPHGGINNWTSSGYTSNRIMRFNSDRSAVHYGPVIIDNQSVYNNYNEGLRINYSPNSWAGIVLGGNTGTVSGNANGWFVANYNGTLYNSWAGSSGATYRTQFDNSGHFKIYGTPNDSNPILELNAQSHPATWSYGWVVKSPNMGAGTNLYCPIGVAYGTRNMIGLDFNYAGSGSTNNYLGFEIYGVGNAFRIYADLHTTAHGRLDACNRSNSASYMESALQIRERGYGGAQDDTWATAPRLSWHWAGRVQAQIGLASNGWLYMSRDGSFGDAYRLVTERGDVTWGINISGNANSANYTTQLLGVNSSNTPYGVAEGNLIRAVWNVKSDNRWYFKAGSYECRVDYANSAANASTASTASGANVLNINNSMGLSNCMQYIQTSAQTARNDLPSNTWHHVLRFNHGNGDTYYKRLLAFNFWGRNAVYTATAEGNGTTSAWSKFWLQGDAVTSAVWNDYAECRKADSEEPGYVMTEVGDDSLTKTTERLQHFAGIVSDTWGFSQGETNEAKTNIAVSGRVLAYTYQDRNNYKPGDCVCAAPGGTVDIMTREEVIQYPDRIVGTVSCVPEYEEWGGGEMADRDPVKVNGRIWIKVR